MNLNAQQNDRLNWIKIAVIGVMCMAQTFPYYLVNSTVPTLFRAEGLALEDFWAFSIMTIPAWAKFLWAPFVDRYGWVAFGRRKSWILTCTLLGVASLWILIFTPPSTETLAVVIAILFVHLLIMSTQDIAVDAYTLENLTEHERGAGSAFKVFAEAVGEALALGGLMYIYTRVVFPGTSSGWTSMILAAGCALILFTLPVLIRREPPMAPELELRRASGDRPRLSKFFVRPDTPPIIALLLVGGFINFMLPPLIGPLLVDKGFSLLDVGIILGTVTPVAAPLGAISGGALITRIGLRTSLMVLSSASAIVAVLVVGAVASGLDVPAWFMPISETIAGQFQSWNNGTRVIYAIAVFIPVVWMIAMTHMVFTVSRMGWASRTQAGTDFTLHGAFYNIGRTLAVAISPFIAAFFGWAVFTAVLGFLLTGLALAYWIILPGLERVCDRRRISEGELLLEPS